MQALKKVPFRVWLVVLDLLVVGNLALGLHCLFTDFAFEWRIAGEKILSVSGFERPLVVSVIAFVVRIAVTLTLAPEGFLERYKKGAGAIQVRVTLAVASLFLTLAVAELGFRLFHSPEPLPTLAGDPELFDVESLSFAPMAEGTWCGATLVTDSHGFRARTGRPLPALAATRVLVLGDSMSYGVGVPAEDTFVCVAESALRGAGRGVHVFNASIPAISTAEERRIFEERGLAAEPDVVLLVWCLNDAMSPPPPWPPMANRLASKLHLFGHLYQGWTGNIATREPDTVNAAYEDGAALWESCQKDLLAIRDVCEERAMVFAVVIYPFLERLDDYPFGPAHERIAAFLEANGIPYRDQTDVYAGKDTRKMWVHPRDHHPSREANRLAGEDLARWLPEILPSR